MLSVYFQFLKMFRRIQVYYSFYVYSLFRMVASLEVLRVERWMLGLQGRAAPPAKASAWITDWR